MFNDHVDGLPDGDERAHDAHDGSRLFSGLESDLDEIRRACPYVAVLLHLDAHVVAVVVAVAAETQAQACSTMPKRE